MAVSHLYRIPAFVLAALFLSLAAKLAITDHRLAVIRNELAAGNIQAAAAAYPQTGGADLYYARMMAAAASKSPDPLLALLASQQASAAAARALQTSDQPANAAYTLASLAATRNQVTETEADLRVAIAAAPNWFKPHWMLAQVLTLQKRFEEAEGEAALACERASIPEVRRTLEEIKAKRSAYR